MITQEELKKITWYDKTSGVFLWTENRGGASQSGTDVGIVHYGSTTPRICAINRKKYNVAKLVVLYVEGYYPEGYIKFKDKDVNNLEYDNLIFNPREHVPASRLQEQRRLEKLKKVQS